MAKSFLLKNLRGTKMPPTRFNDNDFIYPSNLGGFYEAATKGIAHCQDKTILFCGICRDVAETLSLNLELIDIIGRQFKSYMVLLYESDSTDTTVQAIKNLSYLYPIVFETEKLGLPRFSNDERERTRILSYCRNWYLDYIRRNKLCADYVCVCDMDSSGWSIPGFFTSFAQEAWDMIGVNGIQHGQYYDTFPLRITGWTDYYFRGVENHEASTARSLVFRRGSGLHPVLSCFGGLGLYRFQSIMGALYGYSECEGSEHVYLHSSMHKAGFTNHYINTDFISLR